MSSAHRTNLWLAVALSVAGARPAQAQVCSASQLNRDLQTLRRYSLDLRGRTPSPAEIEAVVVRGGLAGTELDQLLASPDFGAVQRERLRADVYGALDIGWENGFRLERTEPAGYPGFPDSKDVFWNRFRTNLRPPHPRACDPTRLQTAFSAGVPIPAADGRDGYVFVEPYWAPGTQIKVCAFEAQAHLVGPLSGDDCASVAAVNNPKKDCGCGPNLRFCQLTGAYASGGVFYETTEATLNRAFAEQTLRFADRILSEKRPWSDLILGNTTEINGPIAHYLRYQTGTVGGADLSSRPDLGYPVPASLTWKDKDTWVKVTISGKSAGILTQPHYLLKFSSNRARANRFYNAFLCSAFQAPPSGLPSPSEPCAQNPNLTQRCGCDACHKTLEPMAARWGHFAERGTHALKPPEFPDDDPRCDATDGGPVSARCSTYYTTRARIPAERPYVGRLKAFLYADGFEQNIADGPLALAQDAVDSGAFATCTVKKEFERLVGRPLREDLGDERALLTSLTQVFRQNNHDLRALVRAVMTSPQYRRQGDAP